MSVIESSFDFLHCERCGRPWPTDKPGLDDHEASCSDEVCATCLLKPGNCRCGRPLMRLPARTDAPWCDECGMTLPNHWTGCPA